MALRIRPETMPRRDYSTCRSCGGNRSQVGPLSHSRLCRTCALEREVANMVEISVGAGPFAEHRLRRTIMAAHERLLAANGVTP